MITFFNNPGSCSTGIHVLLQEVGAVFTNHVIDLKAGDQYAEDFRAANPKGKVPALLRDDGSLVTEFPAIALWIGHAFPEAKLLPGDFEGQLRVIEAMEYMVATVHMRGFTFYFNPAKVHPDDPEACDRLAAYGLAQGKLGLETLSGMLGSRDWLLGEYTIADANLFYITRWCRQHRIDMPANIAAHHTRMLARPAVRRALEADGLVEEQALERDGTALPADQKTPRR